MLVPRRMCAKDLRTSATVISCMAERHDAFVFGRGDHFTRIRFFHSKVHTAERGMPMWASTVTKPNEKAVGVQPLDGHVTNMRDFFVAQRHEVPR